MNNVVYKDSKQTNIETRQDLIKLGTNEVLNAVYKSEIPVNYTAISQSNDLLH